MFKIFSPLRQVPCTFKYKLQSYVFNACKVPPRLNRHTSLTNIDNKEFRQFQTSEILRYLATT